MSLSSFGIQLLTQIFDRLSLKRKKRKPFKRAYLHLWEPEKYHPKHLASFIWQAFEKIFTRGMSESNLKIFLQKDIVDEYLEYAELVFKILKGLAFPSSIYNMPSELRKFLATKLTLFEYSIEKYQLQHLIDEFFGKDKSIIVKESAIPNKMFYLKEITLKAFRGKLDLLETYNFLRKLRSKLWETEEYDDASLIDHFLKALKPSKRQRILGMERIEHGWFYYIYALQLRELQKDVIFLNDQSFRTILNCFYFISCKGLKIEESPEIPCSFEEKKLLMQIAYPLKEQTWIVLKENLVKLNYPFPPRGGGCFVSLHL